jgi:hypothetical protein
MYTLHLHGLETTEFSLDCFEGLASEPLAIYTKMMMVVYINMPIQRFLATTPNILQCALRMINYIV